MNNKIILSTVAIAAAFSFAATAEAAKEKCYGTSKAGSNSCGNLTKTHSCQGQSTKDYDIGEWKYVNKGTCKKLKNGHTEAEAKHKLGLK